MKTLKIIGNCCLVFLAVIAVCVSLGFCYYHFFVKDIVIGVNNIADQNGLDIVKEEDLTEEEKDAYADRWFLEANYFSNDKENGIELQELNFNYFRDWHLTSDGYRATGMQYLGDYKHEAIDVSFKSDQERDKYVFPQFSYYDTTDGISYTGYTGIEASTSVLLNRATSFTVKIDNRPFEIQLNKTLKKGWWIFGSTYFYTWPELFQSVMQCIKLNSRGYGDYYITVDLSDYFTVYEYNTETGKFTADDVSDVIKNYSVLKFHYDENGARNSKQSIFGIIDCNPKYDVEDININTEYWQERMVYNLTEKDLVYRYSDVYQGYFAGLSLDTKKLFADMPRTKVNINLDLQSQYLQDKKINIVGFEYNAFEDFEIDTLTIKGNSQIFYMLDKALYNTKLQTFKYSNGITFDFAENAINNEYVGVVL